MSKIKNFIVNIIGKYTGVNAILSKLNGAKTYIAGAAMVLAGASGLLNDIVALEKLPEVLDYAKGIMQDSDMLRLLEGLAILGVRHAISKNVASRHIG